MYHEYLQTITLNQPKGQHSLIKDAILPISALEQDILGYEHVILNSAGVGWQMCYLQKALCPIRELVGWLEEMLCKAMISPKGLRDKYNRGILPIQIIELFGKGLRGGSGLGTVIELEVGSDLMATNYCFISLGTINNFPMAITITSDPHCISSTLRRIYLIYNIIGNIDLLSNIGTTWIHFKNFSVRECFRLDKILDCVLGTTSHAASLSSGKRKGFPMGQIALTPFNSSRMIPEIPEMKREVAPEGTPSPTTMMVGRRSDMAINEPPPQNVYLKKGGFMSGY
ncbi:hypothetical protein EDD18DRAFT_1108059 [Armillaria luteobubalina]|uniref:Uncharacterized protein n=1 Tax=Armillaria luteobubalina TaxID=153913 RepID=A0AA39PZ55_9AGAR|nr:hypothetical protein EDD18DRAFT_1108059 [Armillaria luteobubalina]